LIWRRGTNVGAIAAMAVGTVATLATMVALGDIFANEPVYVGMASGLVVYVVGSLMSELTRPRCWWWSGIDAVARSRPRDATMW
jgi:solute:Na+ symporter, SSS family